MGFAETFKALSDPIRREILMMLWDGSMSAGEIGVHFDMTGATISYHLKILKKAELIFEKKEKNYIYYTLNTSVVEEVMLWLSELKGGNHDVKEVFYCKLYCNFITNVCWILIMGSVASTGGNTFWKKRRGRSIQQQIICSSRNLSVCFGSAYFM